ncbi:TRAP transporter substrate-binding protein DctP [Ruixingdingia sedimenti]|uniref:TRAP transporter substrate-binding protein DctP n=1 Tax=Ruixingdingia sedimenti TaxID=3073604 RepID=A0ABU1F607_9RHOB|nr:TRAP transporter substrate-binding protein DctP [Xinfangfangia sp. LG-4]MDR5652073.1 TRAP transporter substrate-binding protein DctP [Xinfangfangia sp. LG-4]
MKKFRSGAALLALAVGIAGAGSALADPVKLKFAHTLPGTHYLWEQGFQKFTEAVTAATDGQVEFEVYPAGQLGKDNLAVLNSGLADISMMIPMYAPDKFPLSGINELPGMFTSSCDVTAKYKRMSSPGNVLATEEYDPLGLHVIFVNGFPSYILNTAKKQVKTLADAEGLKIWVGGAGMDKAVRAMGGVPIRLTAYELYDAMTRGTVDGALFPASSIPQYKLETELKYSLEQLYLGTGVFFLAMTNEKWAALPDNVKDAINAARDAVEPELCAWLDADDTAKRDRLVAENGLSVVQLSPEQDAEWKARIEKVAQDWAAELDGQGRAGSATLEAMRAAGN